MKHDMMMRVFVRPQDLTKEITHICKITKPEINSKGLLVIIPADGNLWKNENFHGGYAMLTGIN